MPDLNINIQNITPALALKNSDTFVFVDGLEGRRTTLLDISEFSANYTQANLPATETEAGVIEIATGGEVSTGTDNTRAVTPLGLLSRTGSVNRIGLLQLANNGEAQQGLEDSKALTAASMTSARNSNPWRATTSDPGFTVLATGTETIAGTETTKAVTPSSLNSRVATTSNRGLIQVATQSQVNEGDEPAMAVSPETLDGRTATTTRTGIIELATQTEVDNGTDNTRAVTPLTLENKQASTGDRGIVQLATQAETANGTTTSKAVVPTSLAQIRNSSVWESSTSQRGFIELATQAEVNAGSDSEKAVTPATLDSRLSNSSEFVIDNTSPVTFNYSFPTANQWSFATVDLSRANSVVWITFDMPEGSDNTTIYYRNAGDSHGQISNYVCGRVVQNSIGSLTTLPILLDGAGRMQMNSTRAGVSIRLSVKGHYESL